MPPPLPAHPAQLAVLRRAQPARHNSTPPSQVVVPLPLPAHPAQLAVLRHAQLAGYALPFHGAARSHLCTYGVATYALRFAVKLELSGLTAAHRRKQRRTGGAVQLHEHGQGSPAACVPRHDQCHYSPSWRGDRVGEAEAAAPCPRACM